VDVVPLSSAAITVEDKGFEAKYVYLTGNQIEFVSQNTLLPGMQENVEGLDLSYNDIEFIDVNAFDLLTSLRKLRLNQNWIRINETIDGWISIKLGKTLEVLNLAYNSITSLNDGAFNPLHKLTRLILDGNTGIKLTDATFGKDGLINLKDLSLDNCNLKILPAKFFEHLPKLEYLSLIKNQLTTIPAGLTPVPKLNVLDLSENWLDNLKEHAFRDYPLLKKLYLKEMQNITEYGNCAFCGLSELNSIDFSGSSKLKKIDKNAFGFESSTKESTKKIKTVKMEDCQLESFSEKMLPWTDLEGIAIGGNPLVCDFDIDWMVKALKSLHFVGSKVARCAEPKERINATLQNLADKFAKDPPSSGSFLRTVFYCGLAIGVIGIALTGILYVNKRNGGNLLGNLIPQRRTNPSGFSNLNADVGMEEDHRVFDEEDNEFEPRPAAV